MITTKDSQSHLHTKNKESQSNSLGKAMNSYFCDSSFWVIVYLLNGSVLVSGT